LLEKAAFDIKKGIKPRLPMWLSPTQLRIIPVTRDYVDLADEIKSQFKRVRVDIDNRDETVGKKVREAEKEWIPYIIVVGEKEIEAERYQVRVRGKPKSVEYTLSELQKNIHKITKDKPFRPVPVPIYLENRPKFVG
jgi:threonyl-tRNA synthetase